MNEKWIINPEFKCIIPPLTNPRYNDPEESIDTFMNRIKNDEENKITDIIEKANPTTKIPKEKPLNTRIKEMPEYSPDDEINGMLYTVPSWVGMIKRLSGVPARYASEEARGKMCDALNELRDAAARLQKELEEYR